MTDIITITSTKGGVGKTTTTANLGALLADQGQHVLLVDADVQPTLSSYYPIEYRAPAGLTALATGRGGPDCISRISDHLHIVVSDDPQGRLQNHMLHAADGRWRLRQLLRSLADSYDVVLIDTQGAVGPLQDAAVLVAHRLLSPIPPEILAAREFLRGTLAMLDNLQSLAEFGMPTGPLHGLLYRLDHTSDARMIAQMVRGEFTALQRPDLQVLDSVIPTSVIWREAASRSSAVHQHAPRSPASQALVQLARELFPQLDFSAFATDKE